MVIYCGFSLIFTAGIDITFDLLFVGFMGHACAQLDLLVYRFKQFIKDIENDKKNHISDEEVFKLENDFFRYFIQHHQYIYE